MTVSGRIRAWVAGSGGRVTVRLAGVLCGANLVAQPVRAVRDYLQSDYVGTFVVGARMLNSGAPNLYCLACQRAFAAQLYHAQPSDLLIFAYPPAVAWVLQPLAFLPPQAGLVIFLTALVAALAASMRLLARIVPRPSVSLSILVLAVLQLPGGQALALGQWDPLMLLVAVLGIAAFSRRRDLLAGCLLAVLIMKPQLVWLVPVLAVVLARWRLLLGLALGAIAWLVSSVLLVGVHPLVTLVTEAFPATTRQHTFAVGFPSLLFGGLDSPAATYSLTVALAAAFGFAVYRRRHQLRGQPGLAIALALAASVIAAPHAVAYSLLLVAPLLVLWADRDREAALIAALALNVAYLFDLIAPQVIAHTEPLVVVATVIAVLRTLGSDVALVDYSTV